MLCSEKKKKTKGVFVEVVLLVCVKKEIRNSTLSEARRHTMYLIVTSLQFLLQFITYAYVNVRNTTMYKERRLWIRRG